MALTEQELSNIRVNAGLYGEENSWVPDETIQYLATKINAVTAGVYNTAFDNDLSIQVLERALSRGVSSERAQAMRELILELRRDGLHFSQRTITSPSGTVDPQAEAQIRVLQGQVAEIMASLLTLTGRVDLIRSVADPAGHAVGEVLSIISAGNYDWGTIGEAQIAAAVAAYLRDNPIDGVTQVVFDAAVARLQGEIDANETAAAAAKTAADNAQTAADAVKITADAADTLSKRNAAAVVENAGDIGKLNASFTSLDDLVKANTGSIGIAPNVIPNAAGVVRDYVFSFEDLDVTWLNSKRVNEMEVWMKNTAFHAVDPWAPTADGTIAVAVNETEARAIAIGAGDRIIPVRLVWRSNGQFVALRNTWLEIRPTGGDVTADQLAAEAKVRAEGDDFNKTIIAGEDAATANAALATFLTAQESSTSVGIIEITANSAQADGHAYVRGDVVVFAPGGSAGKIVGNLANYASSGFGFLSTQVKNVAELNAVADGQADDAHGEFVEVTADFRYTPQGIDYKARDVLWLQPYMASRLGVKKLFNLGGEVTPFAFSTLDKIEMLNLRTDPGVIAYPSGGLTAAMTRTIRLLIDNPARLDGDVWYEGEVDGQDLVARTKWAGASTINFVIPLATARLIGQDEELTLELQFYDAANAGNLIARRRVDLPLVKQRAVVKLANRAAYDALAAKDPDTTYYVAKT